MRIGLKNIKKFCRNKSFHRNFWLKFDISHGAITRKVPYVPALSVKKIFWDLKSKIRFHSFVGLDLEYRLSTHNMVISLELKATRNQKWKKLKIPTWLPFWNNRLQVLTKIFVWQKSPNFILQESSFEFFISYVVPEIIWFFGSSARSPDLKRTTFR